MSMFEIATRKKYRFPFRGSITAEDLWDLSLAQLDIVYKTLSKEAKTEKEEESLMDGKKEDQDLLNKLDIVKHVFNVKKTEAEAATNAMEKKRQKERLLELIAQKQDAALADKSIEELTAMVNDL